MSLRAGMSGPSRRFIHESSTPARQPTQPYSSKSILARFPTGLDERSMAVSASIPLSPNGRAFGTAVLDEILRQKDASLRKRFG